MPTLNPVDRLTTVLAFIALVLVAVISAPVSAPILTALVVALALPADAGRPVLLRWLLISVAVGLALILGAVLWGWPLLLAQSQQTEGMLAELPLTWLTSHSGPVSLTLLIWLVLFPVTLMVAGWQLRRWLPGWPQQRSSWAIALLSIRPTLSATLLQLLLQVVGRLCLYSLALWLLGIDAWGGLALLAAVTALLPALPLLLAALVVWLLGASWLSLALLLVFVVVEALFWWLSRRISGAVPLALLGLAVLVAVAALGIVGLPLAILSVVMIATRFKTPSVPAEPQPDALAEDPVAEAIDESMRQEDS
ncbi:hypothetical protein N9W78_01785 [bacterium]|nr:hypothetical protein [bacterium]